MVNWMGIASTHLRVEANGEGLTLLACEGSWTKWLWDRGKGVEWLKLDGSGKNEGSGVRLERRERSGEGDCMGVKRFLMHIMVDAVGWVR